MPTYYVGPGGNDGNSGLTWALRKLTLNGAEDVPVVAGDIIYVGPGVYRESLTVDVSGGAGNYIVYIGDVTGENTDGVGGIVRITGSDNDQTIIRSQCIDSNDLHYRRFRGFWFDSTDSYLILIFQDSQHWIIEDCVFSHSNSNGIFVGGNSSTDINILRCLFYDHPSRAVRFNITAQDISSLVQNCVFIMSGFGFGVQLQQCGGVTVRNCSFSGIYAAYYLLQAPPGGFTPNIIENSYFVCSRWAVSARNPGEVVEDYNTFFRNATDRQNTNVGANSLTWPDLQKPPILFSGANQISGIKYPWWFGELSEWSQIRAIAGNNEPAVDLRGIIRPAIAAKNSWGAAQFYDMEREIGTVRTGVSSMVLLDAGINQMFIPITAEEITVEVYVQREGAYAGVNPQMIIKQPGQADRVTLDAGAAGAWNLLTDTFTPAALPPYVIVEFVSNNTAVAGAFSTFFDDLEVS